MVPVFGTLSALDRLVNDVMGEVTGTALGPSRAASPFSPEIDLRATANEIVVSLDIPGVRRDDIDIGLENGVLTVKGNRKYEGDPADKVWLGKSYGAFTRSFTLPDSVDCDKLYAELAEGVLTIRIPRTERAKPRKIAISGGSGTRELNRESK